MNKQGTQSGTQKGGETPYARVIREGLLRRWHLGQGLNNKKEPDFKIQRENIPGR